MIGANTDSRSDKLAQLTPGQLRLLQLKLRKKAQDNVRVTKIGPRATTGAAPLSFAQMGLWLVQQTDLANVAYNNLEVFYTKGRLAISALAQALKSIYARHDILRTHFHMRGDEPVQEVVEQSLNLVVTDLSGFDRGQALAQARVLALQEMNTPFNFEKGPLVRAFLMILGPQEHVLLIGMHHITGDGGSGILLFDELFKYYNAWVEGKPDPLEPLPIQYADFAAWQVLQQDQLEQQRRYWIEQLQGAPLLLEVPTDKPRSYLQTHKGATVETMIPHPVRDGLLALAMHNNATLFHVLLAGFQYLLHRLSGQAEVNVGIPVSQRGRPELASLIGLFLNTVVVRTAFSPEDGFVRLVTRVRDTVLAAQANQDLPFSDVVRLLKIPRDPSYSPLFQGFFLFHELSGDPPVIKGLKPESFPLDRASAKFEITLTMLKRQEGLFAQLEYNTDLFEAKTARHLLERLRTIFADAVKNPESRPQLLDALQRRQLVAQLEGPRSFVSGHALNLVTPSFHRFASQPALVFGESSLTYADLEEQSSCIAGALRKRGVRPGDRVGIYLERGLNLVSALLGVWRAGATYVPVDPSFPQQRRDLICTEARLVLTLVDAPNLWNMSGPCLSVTEALKGAPITETGLLLDESAAYVIFTSGSTGRPKGVVVPQYAVANFLRHMAHNPGLTEKDVLVAVTTISFDISVLELFLPLTVGARLVLAKRETAVDSIALCQLLDQEQATVMQATPTTWRMLLESGWQGGQRVFCGGESLPGELLSRLLQKVPAVVNFYGPTETTIWSTSARLVEQPVVLGTAIANTSLYVRDRCGELLPQGVVGQLFIGGQGLSQGYYQRPGLTAQVFQPDPFSSVAGARCYATGDRVILDSQDHLCYLGRVDFQVKLRGFRIELGEIDQVLAGVAGVRDVATCLCEVAGDSRLVSFLCGDVEESALSARVTAMLPAYMHPGHYCFLEKMPLTANGKIDRKSLQNMGLDLDTPERECEEPVGATEIALARMWQEILGVPFVSRSDHFFTQGGHSLLGARILARVRDHFGVRLPLVALFQYPVFADLARKIDCERPVAKDEIVSVPRSGRLPLSIGQERIWLLHCLDDNASAYNMAASYRLTGSLDVEALSKAFTALEQRHEALRFSFHEESGIPWLEIDEPREVVIQPVLDGNLKKELTAFQQRPFELSEKRLWRVGLWRQGVMDYVLALCLHHILADGWSIAILIDELKRFYSHFLGRAVALPAPLAIQYLDYSVWQRERLEGGQAEVEMAFWMERMSDAPALLELPTDRPRPSRQTHRGDVYDFIIPAQQTQLLHRFAHKNEATLYSVLLAGFHVLMAAYSGQHDIAIGTPVANRNRTEFEALIGLFMNAIVLRNRSSALEPFNHFYKRLLDDMYSAFSHQDLPFEHLLERIHPERNQSNSPWFQVMLVLQNTPDVDVALYDLEMESMPLGHTTAKLDLTLYLTEQQGCLHGALEYNVDLFDALTMANMMGQYTHLLGDMVARPGVRLCELQLMSAEQARRVMHLWEAGFEQPKWMTFHGLVERQLARRGNEIALVGLDDDTVEVARWTYAELLAKANCIAHALRERGVVHGSRVAIYLKRSVAQVAAVLGALKCGATFVPMDPDYPLERLVIMYKAANCVAVVLDSTDQLPSLGEAVRLDLAQPLREPVAPLASQVCSRDNIYIIFSSGSTGEPKGIVLSHGALVDAYLAWEKIYMLTTEDVHLLMAGFSFDVYYGDFIRALGSGSRLVICPRTILLEPDQILEVLGRYQVTYAEFVPASARLFFGYLAQGHTLVESLRMVAIGADAWSMQEYRRFRSLLPKRVRLINSYGVTEGAVDNTWFEKDDLADIDRPVSIGIPFPNTRSYILNEQGQLLPPGIFGVLFLEGTCLADGYLNRPGLTAQKFIPNPFATQANTGSRLYRTDDSVRLVGLPGVAQMEFRGRVDNQVKLRGFRIELGEIEAVLTGLNEVRECVVLVVEQQEKHLVAFVVPNYQILQASQLRAHLGEHLPEYMVPARFKIMESLPLTNNGKLDRKKLYALAAATPEQAYRREYVAPQNETERMITEVWESVLHHCPIGTQDPFFEMGGHSLTATQVMARIRTMFHVSLPLRLIFEAGTIAELALQVKKAQRDGDNPLPPLMPRKPGQPLLLSFTQQRLWFLYCLEGSGPAYNIPASFMLNGLLSEAHLESALNRAIYRHESLRTHFEELEGNALQVVEEPSFYSLVCSDLRGLPPLLAKEQARILAESHANIRFDLRQGRLLRVHLIQLSERQYVLLLNMHHIISDAWSVGVLAQELAANYNMVVQEQHLPAASMPVQYPDYAIWIRTWLQGPALGSQLAFWQETLNGAPEALDLPFKGKRPIRQTFNGRTLTYTYDEALTNQLKDFALRVHGTLFQVLQSAFAELLGRYGNTPEVCIGIPVANRRFIEQESMIGFFANTLVLRNFRQHEDSVVTRLVRTRDMMMSALAHQDLPFEKLVEVLNPVRDPSRSPLFQVAFAFLNTPLVHMAISGLKISLWNDGHDVAKFDLTLSIVEHEGRLNCSLSYNTDLFEAKTIGRMFTQMEALLKEFVEAPESPVHLLSLMDEAERQQLLRDFCEPSMESPRLTDIPSRFVLQAERTPSATALVMGAECLTYGQLREKAQWLAGQLKANGVRAEDLVALALPRSSDYVIASLAILMAGAAYVPLGLNLPEERFRFILCDTGAVLLLTRKTISLPLAEIRTVYLEDLPPSELCAPLPPIDAKTIAYVMYTSGSTGTPKGVTVVHGAVLRLADEFSAKLSGVDERVLAFAPTAFDASTFEVWATLLSGARLVIYPESHYALDDLGRFLLAQKITTAWLTAALFHQMVADHLESLGQLRLLLAGGDVLSATSINALRQRWPQLQLCNGYGPTENTTFTATHTFSGCLYEQVPIGKPINGTQVYLLDETFQLVPKLVPGQLYTGGAGLARGYWGRPALTAERFVPHPFSILPGERLYNTGDLARWTFDGELLFLGRQDRQVKIRGFRVELGEIESVLLSYEDVQEVAVLDQETVNGKRLVAFIRTGSGQAQLAQLKAQLTSQLPSHLVPSRFVACNQFPVTNNGKLSRRALLAKLEKEAETGAPCRLPRNATEELLQGLWCDILEVPNSAVTLDSNFFELGGHSLLATKLTSRVRAAFGIDLPLRELFSNSHLEDLAGVIARVQLEQSGLDPTVLARSARPLVPIARRQDGGYPLSFAQQRLWFLDQLAEGNAFFNIPMALRLKGALDVAVLEAAFNEIIARHEMLRTRFGMDGDLPVQRIDPAFELAIQVYDFANCNLEEAEANANCIVDDVANQPFELTTDRLIRAALIKLGAESHIFACCVHHIAFDGWSMDVLMGEIAVLYEAFSQGKTSPLSPLAIQYVDYASWQRAWLEGEILDREIRYWKQQLAFAAPLLELPYDRPRPEERDYSGRTYHFHIARELVQQIQALGNGHGVTLFMGLFTAFRMLIHWYSGQDDILIGTDIANRNQRETEGLIGFFINQVTLRSHLNDHQSVAQLLGQTREIAQAAYEHQNLPFDMLVSELKQPRANYSPVFQIKFNLRHAAAQVKGFAGITLEPLGTDRETAQLDMIWTLTAHENGADCHLEYNSRLFLPTTIQRLSQHFLLLVERMVEQPDAAYEGLAEAINKQAREFKKEQNPRRSRFAPRVQ